jgi:hypothetical protein
MKDVGVSNNQLHLLVIAVLIKRLGGEVEISQEEIDDVAYGRIDEIGYDDSLKLTPKERKANDA